MASTARCHRRRRRRLGRRRRAPRPPPAHAAPAARPRHRPRRPQTKDNTGKKVYTEDMVFPTLAFPSDHGLVATVLKAKEPLR